LDLTTSGGIELAKSAYGSFSGGCENRPSVTSRKQRRRSAAQPRLCRNNPSSSYFEGKRSIFD
jgi:hypothetical protein